MKQLQNNFTTPEQSERLLKLGVPADSADMYYNTFGHMYPLGKYIYSQWANGDYGFTPCWSVGRLIEILIICGMDNIIPSELYINKYSLNPSLVENIIHRLERLADLSVIYIDFSKLEE